MIISKNNFHIKPFKRAKVITSDARLPDGRLDRQAERLNHLQHTLDNLTWNMGTCLEFGVFSGTTLNMLADAKPNDVVHGFDSFEGLPEQWKTNHNDKKHIAGYFATDIPVVKDNVKLWVGWFDQQIPEYLKVYPNSPIQYLHIDGDLYSSAWTVLSELNHLIVEGTTILFDEFCPFGPYSKPYKLWPEHEYRALKEWTIQYDREFEILHRNNHQQCAIRITK